MIICAMSVQGGANLCDGLRPNVGFDGDERSTPLIPPGF